MDLRTAHCMLRLSAISSPFNCDTHNLQTPLGLRHDPRLLPSQKGGHRGLCSAREVKLYRDTFQEQQLPSVLVGPILQCRKMLQRSNGNVSV